MKPNTKSATATKTAPATATKRNRAKTATATKQATAKEQAPAPAEQVAQTPAPVAIVRTPGKPQKMPRVYGSIHPLAPKMVELIRTGLAPAQVATQLETYTNPVRAIFAAMLQELGHEYAATKRITPGDEPGTWQVIEVAPLGGGGFGGGKPNPHHARMLELLLSGHGPYEVRAILKKECGYDRANPARNLLAKLLKERGHEYDINLRIDATKPEGEQVFRITKTAKGSGAKLNAETAPATWEPFATKSAKGGDCWGVRRIADGLELPGHRLRTREFAENVALSCNVLQAANEIQRTKWANTAQDQTALKCYRAFMAATEQGAK